MSAKSLVLGSTSGLGQQILLTLRDQGKEVFAHSRLPRDDYDLVGDTTTEQFRENLKKLLITEHVDKVFFSVGSYTDGTSPNLDFAEVESAYKNNLLSGIAVIDTVVTAWIGRSRGKLIVINSIAALSPNPNEAIYGAMKKALSHFTNSVRLSVLMHGIEIIEVFPGAMQTRMTKNRRNWETLMKPAEVSKTIVSLAFQESFSVPSIEIRNIPL
jgi:short-subunit dehydrogenase